ncbi:MAG: PadR family transcriptional regulator [Clostridiales bacterium]|nr:PadR family transcriptional regulator [Clostridiales bacterium]
MSIKHAIMSCLYKKPFSGYDLSKMFDGTGNFYWAATHTQIYRTLSELDSNGMIKSQTIEQEQSPNKKIYFLTKEGQTELFKWLNTEMEVEPIRDKFQLQFSFQYYLSDQEIINNMETRIKKLEDRLSSLRSSGYYKDLKNVSSEKERLLKYLSLEYGVGIYEYELQWLKKGLSRFKELVENSAPKEVEKPIF